MKLRLALALPSLLLLCAFTGISPADTPPVPSATSEKPSLPPEVAEAQVIAPFAGEMTRLISFPWSRYVNAIYLTNDSHCEILTSSGGTSQLKVVNTEDHPVTVPVLRIPNPGITQDRYMVSGRVSWEGVAGDAYLEMWSEFPVERSYFSRTLAADPSAPMGKLTGTMETARPFVLPFDATGEQRRPYFLTVNVVLPGRGRVTLQPCSLFQFDPPAASVAVAPPLAARPPLASSVRWLGFSVTAVSVSLGAALASLVTLARRQQGRTFVLASTWTLMALGFILVGMGLAGWLSGWTTPLWIVALLVGTTVSGVFGLGTRYFRQAYYDGEWRRMAALDT